MRRGTAREDIAHMFVGNVPMRPDDPDHCEALGWTTEGFVAYDNAGRVDRFYPTLRRPVCALTFEEHYIWSEVGPSEEDVATVQNYLGNAAFAEDDESATEALSAFERILEEARRGGS